MIIQFTQGSNRTLDLTASPYVVDNFVPPSTALNFTLAPGTSANMHGGATLAETVASDRTISFNVWVKGSTEAANMAAIRKLQAFLSQDVEVEEMYFEYSPYGFPAPLWGQFGAPLRYHVVAAYAPVVEDDYKIAVKRQRAIGVHVTLIVSPYALGLKQRLASGTGGLFEDVIGSADGRPMGLRIPKSVTNKMTNPVFSHSTWNTGWTAGAGLIATQCTDPNRVYPGATSSARLTRNGAAGLTFYQSINAGNTNAHSLSAVIALEDGSAPTSADVTFYYNTGLTPTFQALGDGLYLMYYDNVTGINAATQTGITLNKMGLTVYLLAIQLEEKAYHTLIGHGDMLGCSWAGTTGASTSSRVSAQASLTVADDTFTIAQGAILVVWKPAYDYSFSILRYLFSCGATSLRALYQESDDKFYLLDNTNSVASAAQTFAAGDVLRLLFIWRQGELSIYKNGTQIATGSTYTPPAIPTSIYIGSTDSGTFQAEGQLLGFQIYDTTFTAAEIAALDAAVSAAVTAGERISTVPFLWTKDGDDIVDNANDSTYDNYAVASGIPGDHAAVTTLELNSSGNFSSTGTGGLLLSNFAYREYFDPGRLYAECSGTADVGNSSGDAYESKTIATSAITYTGRVSITRNILAALAGSEFALAARLSDQSTAAKIRAAVYIGDDQPILSDWRSITQTATRWEARLTNSVAFPDLITADRALLLAAASTIRLQAIRASGSAAVYVDYFQIMPRPIMLLRGFDSIYGENVFLYCSRGPTLLNYSPTYYFGTQAVNIQGDRYFELEPGVYNHVILMTGCPADDLPAMAINYTVTFVAWVEPRWSLIA